MKYICDCGATYSDPDAVILCADNRHGQSDPMRAAAPEMYEACNAALTALCGNDYSLSKGCSIQPHKQIEMLYAIDVLKQAIEKAEGK